MPLIPSSPILKTALREAAQQKRRAMTPADRASLSLACCARLCRHIRTLDPAPLTITGYHPIKDELDVMPALLELAQRHITALPVMNPQETSISFRRFTPGDVLVKAAHGILEPAASAESMIPDIVIVPLLAFDRGGHRLGWGAGYYDRALSSLRGMKPVIAIGAAFALQEEAALPHAAHDEPLDIIVTEHEIIFPSSSGAA